METWVVVLEYEDGSVEELEQLSRQAANRFVYWMAYEKTTNPVYKEVVRAGVESRPGFHSLN